MTRPAVLAIAGADSSCGAGLARDLATFNELDVAALVAVTAVTVQTDQAVTGIHLVPDHVVAQQIETALERPELAAVKIGMLGSAAIVGAVADMLKTRPGLPVVLDPVLRSTSGRTFLDQPGIELMIRELLPLCRIVTPNLVEAAILTGKRQAVSIADLKVQARLMRACGAQAVLIKAGHANGEAAQDYLLDRDRAPEVFSAPRLDVAMRGTGCVLASAIAANLAAGASVSAACQQAKQYLCGKLQNLDRDQVRLTQSDP